MIVEIEKTLKKRARLVKRLMKALRHLSVEQQYAIICSWLSVVELTALVEFQERKV